MATRHWPRRLTAAVFLVLPFLSPAVALAQSGQVVEYYHADAIGSVRAVTNQYGQVITRHDFLPFGEEVNPLALPGLTRLFTGQERDFETGQDHYWARQLSFGLGRFTGADPLGRLPLTLADPQDGNGYVYARNNPLRFVDPLGLQAEPDRRGTELPFGGVFRVEIIQDEPCGGKDQKPCPSIGIGWFLPSMLNPFIFDWNLPTDRSAKEPSGPGFLERFRWDREASCRALAAGSFVGHATLDGLGAFPPSAPECKRVFSPGIWASRCMKAR